MTSFLAPGAALRPRIPDSADTGPLGTRALEISSWPLDLALVIVPLSGEHLEYQIELDTDPEVMRYLGGVRRREQVETEHREFLAEADRIAGLGYWAGFVGGDFAGYWILRAPEPDDQEPVEGRYGFEDLGLTRIFAMTAAANNASRATMAAGGLQCVRTFHADPGDWPPGTDLRAVEYAITREQWNAQNSSRP
ncbi:GNAT family N-acetyltransferase [Streptomyces scopuliridis]|uniref:GNAT family N-acetyltransferase n=1 Tax=Streptomyces scopuliridis TaxID=452529 RepID=A0ACD4ZEM4_9ACTN|nr:GNAT family protein [Streptomyces scopuliridis]WSB32557.1 GNAT family N-acetyltransferase [Streptomyces scopuliridis]WSB96803.1 GNAT family N-acetyltransferase [Streptomyces scopuliridis]WSC09493.1 GNAT family N-acetyltransferase [Streptomyces scopuliridis]